MATRRDGPDVEERIDPGSEEPMEELPSARPTSPTSGAASESTIDRRLFIRSTVVGAIGAIGAGGLALTLANRSGGGGGSASPSTLQSAVTETSPLAPLVDDQTDDAADAQADAQAQAEAEAAAEAERAEVEAAFQASVEQATGEVAVASLFARLDAAQAGLEDALDLVRTDDLTVAVDHGAWGTAAQILDSIGGQPAADVHGWSGGVRWLDETGQIADVSDLWTGGLTTRLGPAFRDLATTGSGGQYFVPWTYYLWAVYYRPSVFQQQGYVVPRTYDELIALADRMSADGLTPFAFGNQERWPAMGLFDQLNLRLNGHRFHLDLLAGRESWSGPEVRLVFDRYAELLAYHQPGANTRTWADAAGSLVDGSAGMHVIGTFVRNIFPPVDADDLDFFVFPELDPQIGTDVVETPIDGWVLSAGAADNEAARAVLYRLGTAEIQERFHRRDPTSVMANPGVDRAIYDPLLAKVAATASSADAITQFLDRDADAEFASEVVGPTLAAFVDDPAPVLELLDEVDYQARLRLDG